MPVGKGSIARATNASNINYSSVTKTSKKMGDIITEIPLHQITYVPQIWRKESYHETSVKELMRSIQTYGMLEPVLLRRINENQFQLLSGYRRLQAVSEIGEEIIASTIIEELGDREAREIYQELHKNQTSGPDMQQEIKTVGSVNLTEVKIEVYSAVSKELPIYLL